MDKVPKVNILKANGELELYSRKKFRNSIKKSGADKELIDRLQIYIEKKLREKMTTDELYNISHKFLTKKNTSTAIKYSLKKAIMQLGPAGHLFEQYLGAVLSEYGYETKTNLHIKGRCVVHEVDVIAKKDNDLFVVEAKYHNSRGIKSDVKTALYVYARFLDIELNKKKDLDYKPWLITNTKFTSQAIKYCECRGMKATGWGYPKKEHLAYLIENKGLYPITIIPSVNQYTRNQFSKTGIYFARDLKDFSANEFIEKFDIYENVAYKIKDEIRDFLSK